MEVVVEEGEAEKGEAGGEAGEEDADSEASGHMF